MKATKPTHIQRGKPHVSVLQRDMQEWVSTFKSIYKKRPTLRDREQFLIGYFLGRFKAQQIR